MSNAPLASRLLNSVNMHGSASGRAAATWAGVLLVSLALAAPALAQGQGQGQDPRRARSGAKVTNELAPDPGAPPSDQDRMHDSYQAKGVDLGLFLLLPKVELDEAFTNNLYATQDDKKTDFITTIRPEFKLRSRFKEHALNVSAMAEQYLHREHTRDNRLDAQFDVDGRYDFTSETQANYFGQVFARHEERGSADDVRGLEPTPTQGLVNRGSVKHQFGRFTVVGEAGLDRRTFGSVPTGTGTRIDNSDRDRWEMVARGRGSYEVFPGYAAVTELSANRRRYDMDRDRSGFDRNSHGYRAEAGIGVDISQLIRGDFLVGYMAQDYKDPRFSDPSGLSFRATFNWTPTTLTIVVPSFERTVNETTVAGASGMVRTAATVTVRHELERNILVTGFGGVYYDEFQGISGQNAWTYEGRGRVIYAFGPEVYVGGEVAQRSKRSQSAGSSFNQTTLMLRLGLQL